MSPKEIEVQKAGRLADKPKRQSLVGGGLGRATLPFPGFQRAEPFGGYEVEKKSGERLPFGEAFICSLKGLYFCENNPAFSAIESKS